MSNAPPLISVLIPAYNAELYITDALASVSKQTLGDFEVIVVDDGSTDGTADRVRVAMEGDSRIGLISRGNTGIVGALNDAFSAARGTFLARMDADDICLPERFAVQVAWLAERAEVVMVGSAVMVMDADGDDVAPLRDVRFTHEQIDAALLAGQWPVVHPTVMIRRAALERVGGYREGTFPHEDHDLFLRLAEVGRVENIERVLLRYRRHPKSVSWDSRSQHKMRETILDACRRRGIEPPAEPAGWGSPRGQGGAGGDKTGPDRPAESARLAQGRLYRAWAWQALGAGNHTTARKYALRAVRCRPLEKENLKLLACLVRGR